MSDRDKWYVFYSDHHDRGMKIFNTDIAMMPFVTEIKRLEQMGQSGTQIERIIVGQEVKIEPVNIVVEWRVMDDPEDREAGA